MEPNESRRAKAAVNAMLASTYRNCAIRIWPICVSTFACWVSVVSVRSRGLSD
jgi:hypothetical protein